MWGWRGKWYEEVFFFVIVMFVALAWFATYPFHKGKWNV